MFKVVSKIIVISSLFIATGCAKNITDDDEYLFACRELSDAAYKLSYTHLVNNDLAKVLERIDSEMYSPLYTGRTTSAVYDHFRDYLLTGIDNLPVIKFKERSALRYEAVLLSGDILRHCINNYFEY